MMLSEADDRSSSGDAAVAEEVAVLVRTLWNRNLPALRTRLDLLDAAAVAAQTSEIPEALRKEAAGTAHKLAGSLGMFGFPEGTRVARELEIALTPGPSGSDPIELKKLAGALRTAVGLERE